MKVLIFMTQFYQLSGAERLAVELAEQLNKRGIHTDILSMYTEDLPGVAEAKKAIIDNGIPFVHFLDMCIHPPLMSIFPAILKLRRLIRENEYDIVETSMVSPTVIASWATQGLKTRHIAGVHDVFGKDRYNSWRHKFWRFSVRANKKNRFYAISDYAEKHWLTFSNTPEKYTRRIFNAIPDDCFNAIAERNRVRSELGISSRARVALFVGRLLKRKGIDTIYEALSPILREQDLYLIYVGCEDYPEAFFGDDENLLANIKGQIIRDNLDQFVFFLGRRNDVPCLMASSDLLVHPARIEGFGLVLAEALAAGLPIVASNVEGIPEVLAGTDSILIEPDVPEALREAVLKVLNQTPDAAAYSIEKGRERAEDFRIGKRINEMLGLFEDVVSGRF